MNKSPKSMASTKPYIYLTIFLIVTIQASSSSSSVFDILEKYGLPKGLLPDCVKDYTLSPEDGDFVVDLEHTCYIQFDYLVYYETRITGTLNMGSITNLRGIQVKSFLVWFNVDDIKVDLPPNPNASIYFQVGFINKKLSVSQFNTLHSCRSLYSSNHIFQPPVDEDNSMLLTE